MYADDLLLISASVSGLQSMLEFCFGFGKHGQRHLMNFNSKKSLCSHFGRACLKIISMKLGKELIEWVNTFKYLGSTFVSAPTFPVNYNVIYPMCTDRAQLCRLALVDVNT